jgi:calcium-dependent protein kinase
MILNKKDFVFDHLADGSDIKDDYKIGDILGSGAFGEVRKCVHIRQKTKRAVKVILKDSVDPSEIDRLHSEINILRTMDHPNVVKLFEAYQDKKKYYIITEMI